MCGSSRTTPRVVTPVNLKERIAALQQRATPPQLNAPSKKTTTTPSSSGSLRERIAKFEEKGGVPVPKGGSFGIPGPRSPDKHDFRKGELYGNRIPSLSRQPLSPIRSRTPSSQLSDGSPSGPSRKRCVSTPLFDFDIDNIRSRTLSTTIVDEDDSLDELQLSLTSPFHNETSTHSQRRMSISNADALQSSGFSSDSLSPDNGSILKETYSIYEESPIATEQSIPVIREEPVLTTSNSESASAHEDLDLSDRPATDARIPDECFNSNVPLMEDPIPAGIEVQVEQPPAPLTLDTIANASDALEDITPERSCESPRHEIAECTVIEAVPISSTVETCDSTPENDIRIPTDADSSSSPVTNVFTDRELTETPSVEVQELTIDARTDDEGCPTPTPTSASVFSASLEQVERAFHETQKFIPIISSEWQATSPTSNDVILDLHEAQSTSVVTTATSDSNGAANVDFDSNPTESPTTDEPCYSDMSVNAPSQSYQPVAAEWKDNREIEEPSASCTTSITRHPIPHEAEVNSSEADFPIAKIAVKSKSPVAVSPLQREQLYVEPKLELKTGPPSFSAVVHSKKTLTIAPTSIPSSLPRTSLPRNIQQGQVVIVQTTDESSEPSTPGTSDLTILLARAAQLEQRLMNSEMDLYGSHEGKGSSEAPPTPPPKRSTRVGSEGSPLSALRYRSDYTRASWSSEKSSEDSAAVLTPPSPNFDLSAPRLYEESQEEHSQGRRSSSLSSGSIFTSPRKSVKKTVSRSNTFVSRMLSRAGRSSSTLALPGNYCSSERGDERVADCVPRSCF